MGCEFKGIKLSGCKTSGFGSKLVPNFLNSHVKLAFWRKKIIFKLGSDTLKLIVLQGIHEQWEKTLQRISKRLFVFFVLFKTYDPTFVYNIFKHIPLVFSSINVCGYESKQACNSISRQNPPVQQNHRNFRTNDTIFLSFAIYNAQYMCNIVFCMIGSAISNCFGLAAQ